MPPERRADPTKYATLRNTEVEEAHAPSFLLCPITLLPQPHKGPLRPSYPRPLLPAERSTYNILLPN